MSGQQPDFRESHQVLIFYCFEDSVTVIYNGKAQRAVSLFLPQIRQKHNFSNLMDLSNTD